MQTNAKFVLVSANEHRQRALKRADSDVPNCNFNRDNSQANLNRNRADSRNADNSVRSSVKVYIYERDLSQPPSMRPISDRMLCSWNILVSLTK